MPTKIGWCNTPDGEGGHKIPETWNMIDGCSPDSEGCRNCWAAKEAIRMAGNPNPKISDRFKGKAEMRGTGENRRAVFTGDVSCRPERLEIPLRWRKPRGIFAPSCSDLFHPKVPFSFVDQFYAVAGLCPQHTILTLTKRPDRQREYMLSRLEMFQNGKGYDHPVQVEIEKWINRRPTPEDAGLWEWPLKNVWSGTSIEGPDELWRAEELYQTPAWIRWFSLEPLLAGIDLGLMGTAAASWGYGYVPIHSLLHWAVIGLESGARARPGDVAWIRDLVSQCKAAGTPVFVKQMGSNPRTDHRTRPLGEPSYWTTLLKSKHGSDPSEWPEDLRVQEYPTTEGGADV